MIPRTSQKKPVLIIGAGLAGLSSAYHLRESNYRIIESENTIGGTSRSFYKSGFTFDMTGHLLHLHSPYTKKLIHSLLGKNKTTCTRNTAIFLDGKYTDYPFQANTFGLSQNTIDACVLGFWKTTREQKKHPPDILSMNFRDWCHTVFGHGIAETFMIPYNQKLFQTPASKMTVDWCGPFVPHPKLEDVIRGALIRQKKQFGYNATFLYPKRGGIQVLSDSLARKISNLQLNMTVRKIDWRNKKARLSNGEVIPYRSLINTMPLSKLMKKMDRLPHPVLRATSQLRCAGVLCLNLGINRSKISDRSWIYFPEKEFPFYRVGFPMNFTPQVGPKGCSSMYVEIPMRRGRNKTRSQLLKEVKKSLIKARILRTSDKFKVVQFLPIPYAYVIYDHNRNDALKTIMSFLKKNKIQSIGRYGGWKYSFMEEAISDGRAASKRII